jgi:hypothetical protein
MMAGLGIVTVFGKRPFPPVPPTSVATNMTLNFTFTFLQLGLIDVRLSGGIWSDLQCL